MEKYIDAFVLPIAKKDLQKYKEVAQKIAAIWKEYGATAYFEYQNDEENIEGTASFSQALKSTKNETVIFGWTVFPSKEIRDYANKKVPTDPRMKELVSPLLQGNKPIFDGSKMLYGGFKPLVFIEED